MKRTAESQLTKEDALKEEAEEKKEEAVEKTEEKPSKEEEKKEEEVKKPAEFKFSFGTDATSSLNFFAPSGTAFPFGSSAHSFPTFSFASSIPLTTSQEEKKEEEEEDDPEKDLTVDDGSVKKMKTLSKEELVNGEEGEETEYTVPKMKLYELRTVEVPEAEGDEEKKEEGKEEKKEEKKTEKKAWQERGIGVLRLNVDKKSQVARILIRREPTHQSMANFNIIHETKATVDPVRRTVTIQTIEPETVEQKEESTEKKEESAEKKEESSETTEKKEESAEPKAKISFYMVRVPSKEVAEELCAKIQSHVPSK